MLCYLYVVVESPTDPSLAIIFVKSDRSCSFPWTAATCITFNRVSVSRHKGLAARWTQKDCLCSSSWLMESKYKYFLHGKVGRDSTFQPRKYSANTPL